jgi:hypothetical protein
VSSVKLKTVHVFIHKPELFRIYKACLTKDLSLEPTALMPSAENPNVNEANWARELIEEDTNAVRS